MLNQDSDNIKPEPALKQAVQRKASFFRTVSAVLWSFLGIRKQSSHELDLAQLNPLHLIVVGVLAAGVFVGVLLIVVRMVISYMVSI
ncbi:MAG: DUF2970 domain-containing protein [Ottowia sp.]|nr:DUF2970 domain-containing protein [Ottowia sp.]